MISTKLKISAILGVVSACILLLLYNAMLSVHTFGPTPERIAEATIRAAIMAYKYEYGMWPCTATQTVVRLDDSADLARILSGPANSNISQEMNPRGIRFLNAGDFLFNTNGVLVTYKGTPYHILIDITGDYCRVWSDEPPVNTGGCSCNQFLPQ